MTLEICWQNPRVSKIIRIPQAYVHGVTQLPQQDIGFNAVLYGINIGGGKKLLFIKAYLITDFQAVIILLQSNVHTYIYIR